ncbi:hypothetical protein XELAEV_18035350mg [Xenopus laevis]|uniref:GIY-YIG domain-containing protein n=1 Tax=Xenopus laevis TaxID=8355 RepID=A0A974CG36_XENLA|nr:hypothetical protein XELAEV_18035350mg [Xenopus laevis]
MGAKFAPSFANRYMGWWEETHMIAVRNQYLKIYICYIDDLLCIWMGREQKFREFVEKINTNDLNLRFTDTFSKMEIEFLDVKLMAKENSIHTTIYRKPCSGNTLLHAQSCHPRSQIAGIPIGQFPRLRRNCSTIGEYKTKADEMNGRFKERGYNNKLIQRAYVRAENTDRDTLLFPQNKTHKKDYGQKISFITRYSRQYKKIVKRVKKFLPILYADGDFCAALDPGIGCVARRAYTLGDLLSPSLYRENENRKQDDFLRFNGCFKCGQIRCITCKYLKTSKEFNSTVTKNVYRIKQYINCCSKGIVYLITCTKCGKQYVGCTIRSLKERIREHINQVSNIKLSNKTNVTRHFYECNGSNLQYLSIQGIEQIKTGIRGGDLLMKLKKREVYWIFHLQTRLPLGLC